MGAKLVPWHFLPDLVSQSLFALWGLGHRQCCDDPGASVLALARGHAPTLRRDAECK